MKWRRGSYGENPAWPGLVDLFAFTMVFFMLVAVGRGDDCGEIRKENRRLKEEVARLTKENQAKKGEVERLKDFIIIGGKQQLDKLHAELKKVVDRQEIDIIYHEKIQEIEVVGKPPITFNTAQFELHAEDRNRLGKLARGIFGKIQGKDFFILINGTADPRRMVRFQPPRNNVELSALRAATVAALLEDAAPGISKHLRVVGLGETGHLIEPPPPDPDEAYKQYRRLNLIIKVDVAALWEKLQSEKVP